MSIHQTGAGGGPGPQTGVIKHVVMIFGENVFFDHYFGTYPVAANPAGEPEFTAAAGIPKATGLSGTLITANPNASNAKNGNGATNPFRLDRAQAATAEQDHDYTAEQTAFDNGAMDLFPYAVGKSAWIRLCLRHFPGGSSQAKQAPLVRPFTPLPTMTFQIIAQSGVTASATIVLNYAVIG